MCDDTKEQKHMLVVGLSCVDIVSVFDGYPVEDSDNRSVEQRWQRGGNASNSSTVLAILGAHVQCMVTIADSHEQTFIVDDFAHYGIGWKHSVIHGECSTPLSIIIVNKRNGSRTILHANKNLPEITIDDFKKIEFNKEKFSWIHFEARPTSVDDMVKMLQFIDDHNKSTNTATTITTSVELEKNRPIFDVLINKADYVFISKEYAQGQGCSNKEEAIHKFLPKCKPGASVICAWGEDGAAAASLHSPTVICVPVHSPTQVMDTLGAGDTFNAATIYALSHGRDLETAVTFGCKVAGTKCGMQGFEGLKHYNFVP